MDKDKGGAKARIFQAAVRVFAAKGYKGATVRDICREAGLSVAAAVEVITRRSFAEAVDDFLQHESAGVANYLEHLQARSPFMSMP